MKLYVAGPMTGLPEYNLPAFAAATLRLQAHGYNARNPGARGVIDGYTWRDYMRDGLQLLLGCEAVALLPGWEASRGATLEVHVANSLDMPVRGVDEWLALQPRRPSAHDRFCDGTCVVDPLAPMCPARAS